MSKDWLPNQSSEEIKALAAEVQPLLHSGPIEHAINALAEIITPILTQRVYVEDIWAGILDEADWTGVNIAERKFRVPPEFVGATNVLTYQNGQTFSQFTANRRQIGVSTEELTTPEFIIDTRELRRQDPIITLADVETAIRRMFLIHKAKRGYDLLMHGFDTSGTNLKVIVDDGTYDNQNQLAFLRDLRDAVEETCQGMVAFLGGDNPRLKLAAEALTLARLKRSGLSADWSAQLGVGGFPNPGSVQYKPALEFPLQPFAFPTATDDINGFQDRGRPIITPGDLMIIGPNVANVALTEPLDPSIIQVGHWQVAYAWRAGYAYIRWSDVGDVNRMARIMVVRKVGVQNEKRGTLVLDSLSADGARFYATRPIDKTTLTNANIVISASHSGSQATGALTPVLKGDLRHFTVTFATPLTPGTTYYITSVGSGGVKDLGGDYITALAEQVVTCG